MESMDLLMFSSLADKVHSMIFIIMNIIAPYLAAVYSASKVIISGSILMAVGFGMIKAGIDKAETLKKVAITSVVATICLMPMDTKNVSFVGNVSNSTPNFSDLPLIVWLPWKSFEVMSQIVISSLKEADNDESSSLSMQTAILVKQNREMITADRPKFIEAYYDYVTICSNYAEQYIIPEVENSDEYSMDNLYAVGLMGSAGIFLRDSINNDPNANRSGQSGRNRKETDAAGYFETIDKGERLLIEFGKQQIDFVEQGMSFYQIEDIEQGSFVTPTQSIDEVVGINAAAYANSSEAMKLRSENKLEDLNRIVEGKYASAFAPENCWEMYHVVSTGIAKWQKAMAANGERISMDSFQGLTPDGVVSLAESKEMAQGLIMKSAMLKIHERMEEKSKASQNINQKMDNEDTALEYAREIVGWYVAVKNAVDSFNLQFVVPMAITTLAMIAALIMLLLPVIAALSPMLTLQVVVNGLKVLGVVYLGLIIFQIVFIVGSRLIDDIYYQAHMAMAGPGGKDIAVLMLHTTIGIVMIGACGLMVLTVAYMILFGESSSVKKADPAMPAGVAAAGGAAAVYTGYQQLPKPSMPDYRDNSSTNVQVHESSQNVANNMGFDSSVNTNPALQPRGNVEQRSMGSSSSGDRSNGQAGDNKVQGVDYRNNERLEIIKNNIKEKGESTKTDRSGFETPEFK